MHCEANTVPMERKTNTEALELQNQMQRLKEKNELKTEWLSFLSHDFKEVFGSMVWLIEAVEMGSISKEDFFKMLPRIKEDAKKNLQTVLDTGEWLKTQSETFSIDRTELNVFELFTQLQTEFEENLSKKNVVFHFKGDKKLSFYNDAFLVFFILKKVLANAIKYSYPLQTVEFSTSVQQDQIIIAITDLGIGMAETLQESLFTFQSPVFQGTDGEIGAGLSLRIVKNFVNLTHGKLEIKSAEGKGTKVSIILPSNR